MNSIKEEVYNEICLLYKKSLEQMSNELSTLKNKIRDYENTNYNLNYKLIKNQIELDKLN